jgi:heme-degrading monooxygenase HmoA
MSDIETPVFRIDSFTVPDRVRTEFLKRVDATHQILRHQPGFVLDRIVERALEDGSSRLVTVVEWSGKGAIADAVRAVRQAHAGDAFSAADFITDNGITADIGIYQPAR